MRKAEGSPQPAGGDLGPPSRRPALARWACCLGLGAALAVAPDGLAPPEPARAEATRGPCIVCRRPIPWVGKWRTVTLDDQTWMFHLDDPPPVYCLHCEHPLADNSPFGPPLRDAAGKVVCRRCAADAVVEARAAVGLLKRVRAAMTGWGMTFPWGEIPVRLCSLQALSRLMPEHRGGQLSGVCQVAYTRRLPWGSPRISKLEIAMLRGLPTLQFEQTLAHELTHAWMALHGCPRDQAPAFREGACDLAAYFYLQSLGTPAATHLKRRLQANPDPVYGDGLRRHLRFAQVHRVSGVLQQLRVRKDFPPGW
ncbi:MAG: protein DA1 [Candidatus Sericytochromatia bacterium]|nr:protein DA1 [Candidatus Sericytochromatia bacterium]